MALSKDRIEALAPDQSSLAAALKLMKPASWPTTARNATASLLWGECQGSGSTPYRVIVSPPDLGYKCTCPSRKFPCKHVLAIMWMHVDTPDRFLEAAEPDWVGDWLSRRKPKVAGAAPTDVNASAAPQAAKSFDIALADTESEAAAAEAPLDPKTAARAATQRERLKRERETAILDGLDEFDRWVADQLQLGLSGFAQRAAQGSRTLSTRLVDAKAQGLATRLDTLISDIFRLPEAERADVLIEQLASLALIAAAYRRQNELPPALAADVRRAVGWTLKREDLLVDKDAPRIASTWIVAATRSEAQPDKLRRLETWLIDAAGKETTPRFAVLVDFVPIATGASAPSFVPGEVFAGEVVFYPSATPLRAQLASRTPVSERVAWPRATMGIGPAVAAYESALAAQPWLEHWPALASGIALRRIGAHGLALADNDADSEGAALPVDPVSSAALTPLLGLSNLTAAFTWNGRYASLLAVDTPIGQWCDSA